MEVWNSLLALANTYPSPHNSQPMRVRIVDETKAELLYDKACGLPAESYGIPFGFVTVGIFLELCRLAAQTLGKRLEYVATLQADMDFADPTLHPCAVMTLEPDPWPAEFPAELIRRRQTSRLPYSSQTVPAPLLHEIQQEARQAGYMWHYSAEAATVDQVVAVNQKTLFYDLEEPGVRKEIGSWLRYSRREATRKRDGLSAECMGVPGPVLSLFIKLHWLWRLPVLGPFARSTYLATMKGVRQIAWITGPFAANTDYAAAGRLLIRIWLKLSQAGVALHPFGSVITNARAHQEFCAIVGEDESTGMAWMLMRLGYSGRPPVAHRRPLDTVLVG